MWRDVSNVGSLHTSPDWGGVHLAPGTPPPPYDTHLLSAYEALKRWGDPVSPAPATTTGSSWVPGMGWRLGLPQDLWITTWNLPGREGLALA